MPRGDTGRTFLPLLATTCELQLAPPSGVVHVSTCHAPGPVWRDR